jgi:hypothetical protein
MLEQSKVRSFDAESTEDWNREGRLVESSTGVSLTSEGWCNGRPSLLEWSTYCAGMVDLVE